MNDQYRYTVHGDREVWLERYLGEDARVVIPDRIEGLPVTKIREQAFYAGEMAEVLVPEGIEEIEAEAFALCESLRRVELPASLKELGRAVFKGCEILGQIVFPNGNGRFAVEDGVLYKRDEQALVLCPPGLETEVFSVPMGTKVVASGAFFTNRLLRFVQLPITLEKIEAEAFLFTSSLPAISLPPGLKEIEPNSFLLGRGGFAEKRFEIYAFPDSVGYRYALDNGIPVHPLSVILTD